jgi:hypothetical protein
MANYNNAFDQHISHQYTKQHPILHQNRMGSYDLEIGQDSKILTSILAVDSKYRDTATDEPNDYTIALDKKYTDVISLKLIHCDIPNSNYNVTTDINDNFGLTLGTSSNLPAKNTDTSASMNINPTSTVTVTGGLYTIGNLMTTLATAINTVEAGQFSVSLTTITDTDVSLGNADPGVIRISANDKQFTTFFNGGLQNPDSDYHKYRLYRSQSIGRMLGFKPLDYQSAAYNSSFSVVAPYAPMLEMDRYVSLHIDGINRCDSNNSTTNGCFCLIPLDSKADNFGLLQVNNAIDNDNYKHNFVQPRKLSKLKISFRDWLGNLYDFRGQNHTLIFEIKSYKSNRNIVR